MKNSTIVLIILILVVGVGLYYVSTRPSAQTVSTVATTTSATTSDTSGDATADWQTYAGPSVTLKYPTMLTVNDVSASGPTDWRIDPNGNPGTLDFSATLPKDFEPQTNFGDAKFTFGESANSKAVADCLTPDQSGGGGPSLTTTVVNGITYSVFTFSDAGAGNLYDSTSYRTVHNGTCFAAEYTIHSSQLANYPPSAGISQFDEARVKTLMDQIVATVTLQ